MTPPIEKFIWDLTYGCPLRCEHCYSESGRRPARVLDRERAMRVVDIILSAKPNRVSISGGEPLSVPWCTEATRRMRDAGIIVTLFTSGWIMSNSLANELATSVSSVALSIDGPNEDVHDHVRGRRGSFARAIAALGILQEAKRQCSKDNSDCYQVGIDYTVTRPGAALADLEKFIERMTLQFPDLDFIRFGAVIPVGLASEEIYEKVRLLKVEDAVDLLGAHDQLQNCSQSATTKVSITDVRYFLPEAAPPSELGIAQLEPDGVMRAFPIYEAKVGNVLEEPLDVVWARAIAWRKDPFVAEQLDSVNTMSDWALVSRTLDRRYGSAADKERISQRGNTLVPLVDQRIVSATDAVEQAISGS
jgi:MoaA/NifB/PqqE/SkfB family radical SAM enzyme